MGHTGVLRGPRGLRGTPGRWAAGGLGRGGGGSREGYPRRICGRPQVRSGGGLGKVSPTDVHLHSCGLKDDLNLNMMC